MYAYPRFLSILENNTPDATRMHSRIENRDSLFFCESIVFASLCENNQQQERYSTFHPHTFYRFLLFFCMDGKDPHYSFSSSGMLSLYDVDDDDDDTSRGVCSRRRWINSRNSRWESSNLSWENDLGTTAADSPPRRPSLFETSMEYAGIGGAAGCMDDQEQAMVDCSQWAPRKPLRRDSFEKGFHSRMDPCPFDYYSGQETPHHHHNDNDSGRAIVDYLTLPSSSPRTSINFRTIRPPRQPVRQVSYKSCGVRPRGDISSRTKPTNPDTAQDM